MSGQLMRKIHLSLEETLDNIDLHLQFYTKF